MKQISTLLGMLLGLALVSVFLAGTYFLIEYVVNLIGALEPQLKTVTIIAAIVAFFCAAIIASGLKVGSPHSISAEKNALYEQILAHWSDRVNHVPGDEEHAADSEFIYQERRLALHGSPKVIAAYMNLRHTTKQEGKFGDDAIELLKKLLVEMRADIGRAELNINKSDLLDLLLDRH